MARGNGTPVAAHDRSAKAKQPTQTAADAAAPTPGLAGPYGASFTGEGARGLTFERRWTRPDVHPYDEITWEYRTAGIANESGKSVFEQKDVEVPDFWSQLATNVVVSKYFRGHLGTPERETSVRQLIDRVVNTITAWAETQHYFATDADLQTFKAELTHLLIHQKMAFNSPVWFNVGIEARPQCSACFINSVDDTMSSIMDLAKTEAMLFKFGSGAGSNLSTIRSSKERMSGGGIASGPVSFMKGYDAFAGVIKSGGKTRRAAKMVILDAGHPDIVDFIDSKLNEEKKAWALIEQGYDPSFTGEAYGSVYFQNANHSVRVTDEFMQDVVNDRTWTTHSVTTGEPVETYKAADLFRKMAEAAWACGDPGIQYDTTINDWHTSANTDRIYASNPCSEYMILNDTACNLASLNLMKFVKEDGEFDVDAFRYAAKLTITAQEILVDNASYPTPKIEENSHKFRPLGLGYANLGALLMSRGLAYDSQKGRNFAAAATAIMHGEAYRQSAVIARDHGGPFVEYPRNEKPFLRVIGKHRDAAYKLPKEGVPAEMLEASRKVFDEAVELGRKHGYRNAQGTVLAPTGTIAFMMDCDTTGIEPDIALIKYKKLVGEGFLMIVNQTVPVALTKLGYSPGEGKKTGTEAVDAAVVAELTAQLAAAQAEASKPHRQRLPAERTAITHKFEIAGHEGYITVGLYEDGRPGEIFLKMAKEGSTVSGLMDSFATTVSVALQYGVPLRDLINKFAHVRFEPSGFTGNQEIPIAKSIVDYIFRWLGSRFLDPDDRAQLGLIDRSAVVVDEPPRAFSAASAIEAKAEEGPSAIDEAVEGRTAIDAAASSPAPESPAAPEPPAETPQATAVASPESPPPAPGASTVTPLAETREEIAIVSTNGSANGHSNGNGKSNGISANLGTIGMSTGPKVGFQQQADAPSCADCGSIMVRNGSCYKCLNCGSTSGCS